MMKIKHENELLAQEANSVDQLQLKAVYRSDTALLSDKLANAYDILEQREAEVTTMSERIADAKAIITRSQVDR